MRSATASNRPKKRTRGALAPVVVAILSIIWSTLWLRAVFSGIVSWHWLAALLLLNIVTLLVYRADKLAALRRGWRVSEARLHTLEVLGGWPMAYLARQLFRHKTLKTGFLVSSWLCVLLNLGGTYAMLSIL